MNTRKQLLFENIPKEQLRADFLSSEASVEMVEVGGRIAVLLGLPRSMGQIYGLLFFSAQPLSLNNLSSMLGVSKGSASTSTRQLVTFNAIRKVWIAGDRQDYYEVVEDLGYFIRSGYANLLKPRFESSKNRLTSISSKLQKDITSGAIQKENREILEIRIKTLNNLHDRITKFLPLLDKLLK